VASVEEVVQKRVDFGGPLPDQVEGQNRIKEAQQQNKRNGDQHAGMVTIHPIGTFPVFLAPWLPALSS
jgi:hypothetical protein